MFRDAYAQELVPKPLVRFGLPSAHTSAVYSLLLVLFGGDPVTDVVEALRPGGFSLDPLDYQVKKESVGTLGVELAVHFYIYFNLPVS